MYSIIVHGVYTKETVYPRYAWIAYDWYPPRWWTLEVSKVEVNCTDDELSGFIEGMISLKRYPIPEDVSEISDAGIVSQSKCS